MPKHYTGKEYLEIDIASHFGLDKTSFEKRIKWVELHEDTLENLEDGADDFFQFSAAVMAYREAQAGKPSGYMVSLDAIASGPQLLSVLIGCKVGAANTGATGQKRVDTYGIMADTMSDLLGYPIECSRADIKYSFMPHFYGSEAEPKNLLGEDSPEYAVFYQATDMVCPGANMLLPAIMGLWNDEALSYQFDFPDGGIANCMVNRQIQTKIEVDTIEGHPVFDYIHTVNEPIEFGEEGSKFLPSAITHGCDGYLVRELTARCDHDKGKLRSAQYELLRRLKRNIDITEAYLTCERSWRKHECISLVGTEYVNSWSVNQMSKEYCEALLGLVNVVLKRPSFKVVSVHDCFKCLPNYMDWVRQTYIDILCELADSRVLDAILSDIAGYAITVPKLSDDLSDLIKDSEYPLA